MSDETYDVVIVGGRPAGASLATRLGRRGVRVLVVDKDTFPSLPGVPSSPILHPGTLAELDDLGVDEAAYADPAARIENLVLEFDGHFKTEMRVPRSHGRDYLYGIDRRRFDHVLWQHLERFESVTRWDSASMTDVTMDDAGRVTGVVVARGGSHVNVRARCVVGADGRFSHVARKVGAAVTLERNDHCSTVYYADWENVAPVLGPDSGRDGGGRAVPRAIHILATGKGIDVLSIPYPGGKVNINTHERADRVDIRGDAQGYYSSALERYASVAKRLENAKQVDDVVGIKKVGNGYRQASGKGWVLVGDALHYKDPVDGQGIYDALVCTRALDAALAGYLHQGRGFESAMSDYERAARAATEDMFIATTDRLKQELYDEPPVPVIKTLIRWMLTDSQYQERFLRFLSRDIPPKGWLSKELMLGCAMRGVSRDLRRLPDLLRSPRRAG